MLTLTLVFPQADPALKTRGSNGPGQCSDVHHRTPMTPGELLIDKKGAPLLSEAAEAARQLLLPYSARAVTESY